MLLHCKLNIGQNGFLHMYCKEYYKASIRYFRNNSLKHNWNMWLHPNIFHNLLLLMLLMSMTLRIRSIPKNIECMFLRYIPNNLMYIESRTQQLSSIIMHNSYNKHLHLHRYKHHNLILYTHNTHRLTYNSLLSKMNSKNQQLDNKCNYQDKPYKIMNYLILNIQFHII